MKIYRKGISILISVALLATNAIGKGDDPELKEQINWESFLSRHDLVWERAPDDYFNAPFLGNGLLGAMLYKPIDEAMRLDVGRMDVVEHRKTDARSIVDNGRLPVGYFTLDMNYDLKDASGRLDLYNAEANINIVAANGQSITLRTLVFRAHDAILVEFEKPAGLQCNWTFHPEPSIVPRNPKVGTRYLNPPPECSKVDGINICTQKRDAGGSYTTAWKVRDAGNNVERLIITVQDSYPGSESIASVHQITNYRQHHD